MCSTTSFDISALDSDKAGVQHRKDIGGPFHEIRLVYPPYAIVVGWGVAVEWGVGVGGNSRLSSGSKMNFLKQFIYCYKFKNANTSNT